MRDGGYSQTQAAAHFGVSTTAMCEWVRAAGIDWRNALYKQVRYRGEMLPLREAARRAGVNYHTAHSRWMRGWRGPRLLRKVRSTHSRQPPRFYEVGLSREEWDLAIELCGHYEKELDCQHAARRKVADRFGVPVGALGAAIRGEWDRLG